MHTQKTCSRYRLTARLLWVGTIAMNGLLTGCGGSESNLTDVRRSAAERPDWTAENAEKGKLSVPGDEPFNCPQFRSGQTGKSARGEAKSVGMNGATCRAETDGQGNAWGEFQLGYCFDNASKTALDAVIKVRLSVTAAASQKGEASDTAANVTAKGIVRFSIKDSNGQIVRQEELLSTDLTRGLTSSTTKHALVYDARFEPDTGYYLIVGGRVDVESTSSGSAILSAEVSDVEFEMNWRAALGRTAREDSKSTTAPAER